MGNWQNSNTPEEKIKQEILENKNGNKTENAKKEFKDDKHYHNTKWMPQITWVL